MKKKPFSNLVRRLSTPLQGMGQLLSGGSIHDGHRSHNAWHLIDFGDPFHVLNLGTAIFSLALFSYNQWVLKRLSASVLVHYYFNDFLGMGVLLPVCNWIIVADGQKHLLFRSPLRILAFSTMAGLFWEYATPLYLPSSTTDPLDLCAYLTGGLVYYLVVCFT